MKNACFPAQLPSPTDSAPVIIIGSGIAGLYTALELAVSHPVILLTKASLMDSNTAHAQGGIAAALGSYDSPGLHYQDTMMAGAGLCDPTAVLTLVHEGPERVKHLIDLGVPFDREDGEIALTREAAHSRRRILHADGDATGRYVAKTLVERVQNAKQIQVYEDHFIAALITNETGCCGVLALYEGQFRLFLSAAVVLATGGWGHVYGKTTNPGTATGDGLMLAHQCGATLRDLEFVQFHPTALYLTGAPPFLISEAVRGEGAILLNHSGERFMPRYHALAELAPRDIVARSIFAEIEKTKMACVYLDLAKIGAETVTERFPNIYTTCLEYGLDITKNPIPVAPAAHYMMGGVVTDLCGRTNIPGLYAIGEVASTGVHGANRLASNSLLEGLVFGGRVAEYLMAQPLNPVTETADLTVHYPEIFIGGTDPSQALSRLHQIADHHLGIVRDASGLQKAIADLNAIRDSFASVVCSRELLELQNLYLIAMSIAQAALTRTESRGGHFRSDYPAPDTNWRKHILFRNSHPEVAE